MSSPKPLGFYGLNLVTESCFDSMSIDQLVALMSIVADDIYDLYEAKREEDLPVGVVRETEILSLPQRLALIRATCDRIELKLMEEAK